MNIYRRLTSGRKISIDHFRSFWKNVTFSIQFIQKLTGNFLQLPRYEERFSDTRTGYKISIDDLSSDIEIFFNFLKHFPLKCRNNGYQKLLEGFGKKEFNYQTLNSQYKSFQKR